MSLSHRGSHAAAIQHRRHVSSFVSLPNLCLQPTPFQVTSSSRVGRRSASSLSTSSFEAPEPPKSQGQAVFPDIEFIEPTSLGDDNVAAVRNADTEAVFVVNGSSRGIGLQFVASLLDRTKGKVIACCRSPSTAHDLNNITSKYPNDRIQILPLDVEEQSSIDALATEISQSYGRVDALFNVAGILGDGKTTPGPERSIANIERDWMTKTLAVNVVGPTMLAKALSPLMRTTGRKSVKMNNLDVTLPTNRPPTVIANLSARVGSISDNQLGGWYSYRISKSALNQATRTMGLELKRQGTWIVALHPGTTNTDLSKPFQRNVKEGRLFPVEFTVRVWVLG